ncbi:MAG: right-handed parallel beta-helix repeat-containing protein, partial [Ignavibacteria bacterium]|nr:right-handed parallel beta-helix repeat-containing protein [Ignavibacteria bacterium]
TISFSPSQQINEGNSLSVRFFYKLNYPSLIADKYVPAALDEVKKYKVSIHVGQVDCLPIPTSCQPGVKTPKYPPNVFTSNTQTVASVWNVTKNPNLPFATIKEAVESPLTVDNDLIQVCPGWYVEKVIIDKSITVFSTDGAKSTIVEAAKIDDASKRDNIFTLKKSGTVISGFSIINGGKGVILNNGLVKVNKCELKNNIFTGNFNSSIEVENGDYNNIHDNTAENPVYIIDGNNNTIEKNTIGIFDDKGKNQIGITIWNSSQKNIIKNNVIGGNLGAGISLSGVNVKQTEIKSNKIGTNADGTKAKPNKHGIYLRDCGQAYIEDNLISGNIESGILLSNYSSANNIKNNIIGSNLLKTDKLPNQTGIKLEYENEGNLIEGNLISGNLISGIDLVWLCINNQIINNMIGSSEEENTNLVNGIGVNIRRDSRNNLIENNVFACNVTSLLIIGDGADSNKVLNNKFGTNKAGTKILPSISGIALFGGKNNFVSNNLISGHSVGGIAILGDDTRSNTISANKIGVDIT